MLKKRKREICYLLMIVLSMSFLACGKSEEKETTRVKQEFYTVMPQKDYILDPHIYKEENARALITQLWEGICEMKEEGARLVSAETIEHSEDFKTWTIRLRKDLKWSDGKAITAETFKKSWEAAKKNPAANEDAYKLALVKEVKAKDEMLEVKLTEAVKDFDQYLATPIFFPIREENKGLAPTELIVNGAFKIASIDDGKIVLERNEAYWDNINTRLKKVEIYLMKDKIMAYEMFPRLEIDYIGEPFHRIPYERRKNFLRHPQAVAFPVNRYSFVEVNEKNAFLGDKKMKNLMYMVSDPEFMGKAIIQNDSPSIFPHPHPVMSIREKAQEEYKAYEAAKKMDLSEELYLASYQKDIVLDKRYLLSTLKEWISLFKLPIRVTGQKVEDPDFQMKMYTVGSHNIEDFYYYINQKYGTKIHTEEEFLEELPVLPMNKVYFSALVHSDVEGLNIEPNGDLHLKYINKREQYEEE